MHHAYNEGIRPASTRMLLVLILLPALAMTGKRLHAGEEFPGQKPIERQVDHALGSYENFGRWDAPVLLVYDPDDAPDQFADTGHFLDLLMQASDEWESICGIRFNVLDPDNTIEDDETLAPESRDGLVRVSWTSGEGFAGRAGPETGNHDYDLGYRPFTDGEIELNLEPGIFQDDEALGKVLVHEIGHLMGLGHSDNPYSIMYANPYTRLAHPREDDIRAAQTLYGPPNEPVDVSAPQPAWNFAQPPDAPASRLAHLFMPAEGLPDGPSFSLQSAGGATAVVGELITTLDDDTAEPAIVRFNLGAIDNEEGTEAINRDIRWVITDPAGYIYREVFSTLACQAGDVCINNWLNIGNSRVIKAVPGTWWAYIVDVSTDLENPVTLISMPLPVNTSFFTNTPPVTRVTSEPGSNINSVVFRLRAEDFDADAIRVKWHVPGRRDLDTDGFYDTVVIDDISPGDELVRTFNFDVFGDHSVFVELLDDAARYEDTDDLFNYDNAGRGFQTLIRMDLSIPYILGDTVDIRSTQSAVFWNKPALLAWMAGDNLLGDIIAYGRGSSSAGIFAGVSSNGGVSHDSVFRAGDNVSIAGRIEPEVADTGKTADIFIVLYDANNNFYYRDLDGIFQPWNTRMSDLEPAFSINSLSAQESFEIYQGILAAGKNRVFIGYRLLSGGPIHLNSKPLRVDVL